MIYDNNDARPTIAYLFNSFPCLSETFIVQEVLELERQGASLRLFALAEPTDEQRADTTWDGKAGVIYMAKVARWLLWALVFWRLLKAPLRFLRTTAMLMRHYPVRSVARSLVYAAYLIHQLEREGITHLHAHYATTPTTIALTASLLSGISYSFTAHAHDIYLTPQAELAHKMRMARFVVTCTGYNQKYLETLLDQHIAGRIHCIYHGLNLRAFPPPDAAPPSSAPPLILSVGRLVEKKGQTYLLHACQILKSQGYHFTCSLVGDGPLHQTLAQEIHDLALTDCVMLIGAVPHQRVIEMYQQAAVFVLPCIIGENGDRDGIPNVLVEALCLEVSVVSTPISGIPELVTSEVNGLLVPPRDSAALALALGRLLDDSALRNRMVEAGRQTVLDRFDMARNASHLLHLLYADQEDTHDY